MSYGKELIIDMHECNIEMFNRSRIRTYLINLCSKIDMNREDLHWWDYEDDMDGYLNAPSHLKGTTCIQFISTSNITIHALDDLKKVFINIFSCKEFDTDIVVEYTSDFFEGNVANHMVVDRL